MASLKEAVAELQKKIMPQMGAVMGILSPVQIGQAMALAQQVEVNEAAAKVAGMTLFQTLTGDQVQKLSAVLGADTIDAVRNALK